MVEIKLCVGNMLRFYIISWKHWSGHVIVLNKSPFFTHDFFLYPKRFHIQLNTISDLPGPIAFPMCLPRIIDQNMFSFSQWSFYIFQICFISFEILPPKSHSKEKNE